MRRAAPCPNCGLLPVWHVSSDGAYAVKLEHVSATCPGRFQIEIHHHTRAAALGVWSAHVNKNRLARAEVA